MNHRFASSALTEVREAIQYYEEKENGLGASFLSEVESAMTRILANPEAWHPLSPRARRCRTHRFPFGLVYQIRPDEILILGLMDLRRDPSRWKHLL